MALICDRGQGNAQPSIEMEKVGVRAQHCTVLDILRSDETENHLGWLETQDHL